MHDLVNEPVHNFWGRKIDLATIFIVKLPFTEREILLQKALRRTRGGIQYVAHIEGDGAEMF